jgi:hypothetical protein
MEQLLSLRGTDWIGRHVCSIGKRIRERCLGGIRKSEIISTRVSYVSWHPGCSVNGYFLRACGIGSSLAPIPYECLNGGTIEDVMPRSFTRHWYRVLRPNTVSGLTCRDFFMFSCYKKVKSFDPRLVSVPDTGELLTENDGLRSAVCFLTKLQTAIALAIATCRT